MYATNATKITASFCLHCDLLFLSHLYLVESLKTWFRRIAALLVCYFCPAITCTRVERSSDQVAVGKRLAVRVEALIAGLHGEHDYIEQVTIWPC